MAYELEFWDDESWVRIPNQVRQYANAEARKGNEIVFPTLETSKVRYFMTPKKGYHIGVSEIEVWGDSHLPVSTP